MKEVLDFTTSVVKSFHQQHNYGKSKNQDLMQHCRSSVEKYLFSILHGLLLDIYLSKSTNDDRTLVQKAGQFRKIKGRELMRLLEFKEKYMIVTEEEEEKGRVAYGNSINLVNKVEDTPYPHEKLGFIMQMYAKMKTDVIDFSKGRFELEAMDDQMPVFIYIMIMAKFVNPLTEMNMLLDYLRYEDKDYDTEQLLVTNLQASLMYILKEFNPEQVP
eukprot:TRINITY_DN3645_c0_g2_i1.p1 TRINITY_DN3645_c0_g2~~TRINITY_DN3645_c0_g2_i1.p1  ORF type:complete len:216 (-),score=83.25 TRINITY_DN3645_c0_g2_i1:136-783(-)